MPKSEQAHQIHISKQFWAAKEILFKEWTEEDQLKKWWRPMDKELISVENDIRQGGKVIYTFNNNLEIGGEYRQVQGNEELVYSWIWNLPEDLHHKREYLMTVRFKGDKQQSELEVVQENFANEQFIGPHQQGWERALLDLQDYLEKT